MAVVTGASVGVAVDAASSSQSSFNTRRCAAVQSAVRLLILCFIAVLLHSWCVDNVPVHPVTTGKSSIPLCIRNSRKESINIDLCFVRLIFVLVGIIIVVLYFIVIGSSSKSDSNLATHILKSVMQSHNDHNPKTTKAIDE